MAAIVSHAQGCPRKSLTCILVDFRDFQFRHFFIGKHDNDGLCVCDFNVLMVVFVQHIAFWRDLLGYGHCTGHILNRNLAAAVCHIMPDGPGIDLDLKHRPCKPFLCAFCNFQDLKVSAGLRNIWRARIVWRTWLVRGCITAITIKQIYP